MSRSNPRLSPRSDLRFAIRLAPRSAPRLWTMTVLACAAAFAMRAEAADPFLPTNYDEPYRGQYHFSQQSGWMNDINGLWHHNGTYYLTYQTTPNSRWFDFAHTSWGMATSTDLVHWTQKPVIAEPDAVQGTPMSGSTVVDVNNTSGLRTGSNPVFVSMHSTNKVGNSLFYSNDLGVTWTKYAGNPVIPGNDFPRDPHVFWHAPTNKWVMVEYGAPQSSNGTATSIWNSPDLIHWTLASVVDNLGHECADLFPLTYRGVQKWVLWAGDSSYLIGDFDGSTFRQDPGGPYLLDQSPFKGYFYAAQTFNIASLPSPRVIQMGWHGGWATANGSVLAPEHNRANSTWSQNATFPTVLTLADTAAGVRMIANPIPEISKLYTATKTWPAQTLGPDRNPLDVVRSKAFDLTMDFDFNGTSATQVVIRIANRSLVYDIPTQKLDGAPLPTINGKLRLRLLADWSQLEIFGNDGQYYSPQRHAFTPWDSSLSITSNAPVSLTGMTWNELGRAWQGAANPALDESIYTRYEAEAGTMGGGATKVAYPNASGGYNLGNLDNEGAYGQVKVKVPVAGTYELVQRYANGFADTRTKSLYVNGARIGQFSYAPTGGWSSYRELRTSVTLREGSNTIRVQRDASDSAATDFDYFLISKGAKVEWEGGTVSGGATFNAYADASGGAQLGNLDAVGSAGQVSVQVPVGGLYDLGLTYANGTADVRRKSLYVNGRKVSQMAFPSTGGWTSYGRTGATVALSSGANQISIRRDAGDDPSTDFDFFTLASRARLEAEEGTLAGGASRVNQPASSGNAQVGNMDATGAYFEVVANAAKAGKRKIVLRYANGYADTRTKTLYINGERVAQLSFAPTGGWGTMAEVTAKVKLNKGGNRIRVQVDAGDTPGTDFDYILVP